ncbi:MAG TPA: hypothetical protein VJ437_11130 [Acidiferrobacterales bacterium]|nr:hypothetical protein [Acidiferrobacterales bacterium]
MNDDIERLLNAPPDNFEWYLFHAERDLQLLEARLAHTARVTHALDNAFDNLLTCRAAEDDDDPADTAATRALIARTRGFRVTEVDEQLTRLFSTLHKMHALYRDKTP